MIAAIGDAFHSETEGFSGKALEIAVDAAKEGASSCLLGSISTDRDGKALLEYLVDHFVMFDPDLSLCPLPTDEAPFSLTKDGLLAALKANSDVRLVWMGGPVFAHEKSREAVFEALDAYAPAPIRIVEYQEGLSAPADIVLVEGDAPLHPLLEDYGAGQVWFHTKEGNVWMSRDGWFVKEPGFLSVGTVLARLEEAGCFGVDGGLPALHLSSDAVEAALKG